ncbi:MAG: hypothetical protein MK171_07790 [Pirellulales bacterium]|nr:hypothetical protein [Pirellulales bacterium]
MCSFGAALMDFLLGSAYWLLIVLLLMLLIDRQCRRIPAFRRWRQVMRVAALVWCGTAILKKFYLDSIIPPGDAIWHEAIAREIAELLVSGSFAEAFDLFGFGNPAYRFLLGVFYAISDAPELVTYTVNGALAYWGILAVLEAVCRHSGCTRLPASVVVPCLFLPSGLLWTTTNLKEGLVLWGICMMLQWTFPQREKRWEAPRGLALIGMIALGLVRPHIAMIWIVTINLLGTWRSRRFGLFVLTSAGALACVFFLKQAAPRLFEAATGQGVTTVLEGRYEQLTTRSHLASSHFLEKSPTPVWTGVTLILFRPWPWEVSQLTEMLAGVEVWWLASIGIWAWVRVPNKLDHLKHPCIVALLIGLALFGFFFTYMYNMGLVVRQRLMVFPAVWLLYSWPLVCSYAKVVRSVPARRGSTKTTRPQPQGVIPAGSYQGS